MNTKDLESALSTVIVATRGILPDAELDDMLELVTAGEPGVALEEFCTQLEEHEAHLSGEHTATLVALAGHMGIRVPPWVLGA
jgi:hypothetical protein